MNPVIQQVTDRIAARSEKSRALYLQRMEQARAKGLHRGALACGNLAHGFAACSAQEKSDLRSLTKANIGIISSYNDMLVWRISRMKPIRLLLKPLLLKWAVSRSLLVVYRPCVMV